MVRMDFGRRIVLRQPEITRAQLRTWPNYLSHWAMFAREGSTHERDYSVIGRKAL